MSAKYHENKCKDLHHAKYQHFAFCSFTVLNVYTEGMLSCGMVRFPTGHY